MTTTTRWNKSKKLELEKKKKITGRAEQMTISAVKKLVGNSRWRRRVY
jgi:hypothetical protein